MALLAILWFIFGFLWYVFCVLGYYFQWKLFTDHIDMWNPMLSRQTNSRNTNLLIMGGCALVAIVGCFGLWFGFLWALVLAFLMHANEAYRGVTYYMKEGLYWESIKHTLIHTFVCGYIFAWAFFVKYAVALFAPGGL